MPISTPTNLTNGSSTSTLTSVTSATISPSGNALLLMWQLVRSNSSSFTPTLDVNPTTTLSGGLTLNGGDYVQTGSTTPGVWTGRLWVARVGASPGTGTVTFGVASGGTIHRWLWAIAQIASGFDIATPVRQWTSGTTGSPTLALTPFASSPLAGNMGFGGYGVSGDFSPTPSDSYIELLETGYIEASAHRGQLQYRDSPGTTCGLTNGSNVRNLGVAIEIAAASAASSNIRRSFLI